MTLIGMLLYLLVLLIGGAWHASALDPAWDFWSWT